MDDVDIEHMRGGHLEFDPGCTTCTSMTRVVPSRAAAYGRVTESIDLIAAYPQVVLGRNIKHYIIIPICLKHVVHPEERALFDKLRRPVCECRGAVSGFARSGRDFIMSFAGWLIMNRWLTVPEEWWKTAESVTDALAHAKFFRSHFGSSQERCGFQSFLMARASDGTDVLPVSPVPASSSNVGSPNGARPDFEGTGYRASTMEEKSTKCSYEKAFKSWTEKFTMYMSNAGDKIWRNILKKIQSLSNDADLEDEKKVNTLLKSIGINPTVAEELQESLYDQLVQYTEGELLSDVQIAGPCLLPRRKVEDCRKYSPRAQQGKSPGVRREYGRVGGEVQEVEERHRVLEGH